MEADVVDHLPASGVLPDDDDFRVHHSAGRILIEAHELRYLARVAMIHFLDNFLGRFRFEVLDQVSSFVRVHLLDDVGSLFGIELLHHLCLKALVELRDGPRRRFLVERTQDGLPLCRRDFFHNVGDVRRVEFGKLLARKPQLHAPQRIGLDQVDKFPPDGSPSNTVIQAANPGRRHQALRRRRTAP